MNQTKVMLKHTKKILEDEFYKKLEAKFPDKSVHEIRKLSLFMAEETNSLLGQSNAETLELYRESTLKLEQHRKAFRDNIDMIQKNTQVLLNVFQKESLVTIRTNPKTKKTELVGRSAVITKMVEFINQLNDLIMDFYENVYEIKADRETQTKLFS